MYSDILAYGMPLYFDFSEFLLSMMSAVVFGMAFSISIVICDYRPLGSHLYLAPDSIIIVYMSGKFISF